MSSAFAVSGQIAETPIRHHERVQKAAREFEAQLLSSLLAPLEKSFSAVPGEDPSAGSDNYSYLGVQALSSALSSSGGIGIADLVVRQLVRTEVRSAVPGGTAQDPSASFASH